MKYHVVCSWGGSGDESDDGFIETALAALDETDSEHPNTWLTHESGWTLDVYETGLVIWDNMETSDGPRHLVDVSRQKALELWLKLSRGEIEAIELEAWCPGPYPPRSAEVQAELEKRSEEMTLASSRKFYELLGPERETVPCQHVGCPRGAIPLSVFCRMHHFESICHRQCPFHD